MKILKHRLSIASLLTIAYFVAAFGHKPANDHRHTSPDTETNIRQRIAVFYKGVGKSTIDADGNVVDYIHSSFNRDSAYCSQRYYALMQEALAVCDATGDILFDYDHWVCGQDFSDDFSCRVARVYHVTDSSALADLIIHNFGDRETTIALRFERGDWYIDDFSPADDGEDDKAAFRRIIQQGKQTLDLAVPRLSYDKMQGSYHSLDDQGNSVCHWTLHDDGTATWSMTGSSNHANYTYTISGNTICLSPRDVDSEEDCYEYDADTRTLKNEQGAVYFRQKQ